MFRIRIDIKNDLNSDQLLEVCDSKSHVVVRHELPHGNPHFHLFVDNGLKENTFRQRLKRKFPFLESSDYSIKTCDPNRINEYVQYMFNTKHGNKWELIDVHNFDDNELHRLQIQAKDVTDEFASNKKNKSNSRLTIWDIAQEVASIIDEDIRQIHLGNQPIYFFTQKYVDDQEYKIRIYTEVAIQTMRKHKKAFDEFLLRKVISTAMSSQPDGVKLLVLKMHKNFVHYL